MRGTDIQKEFGTHDKIDSVVACLNCDKPECNNCLDYQDNAKKAHYAPKTRENSANGGEHELRYFKSGEKTPKFPCSKVPLALFDEPRFSDLNIYDMMLYGLLVNRIEHLRWYDKDGKAYTQYSIENICDALRCCLSTASKAMADLEAVGLIERNGERVSYRGAKKIYVKRCW